MKKDTNKETGKRLKKLRENNKWSQTKLAKVIHTKNSNFVVISENENETGKQRISHLERTGGLTVNMALIYADIFNVSLDYIYGRTDDWKPEYKGIKEQLRLSDESISQLDSMKKNNLISILDYLLNPQNDTSFIELLQAFQEHSSIKSKANMDRYKMYLSNSGIVKYEKNKTPRITEKEAEQVSLFRINEITRKIANEIKNKEIK